MNQNSFFSKTRSFYESYRFRRSYKKIISKKLHNFKKNSSFKPFPLQNAAPAILNYSFFKKSDIKFLDFFYSANGEADKNYIPLTTYYSIIEPKLNDIPTLQSIADKNSYNKLFPKIKTPRTFLRKINNFYYNEDYKPVVLGDRSLKTLIEHESKILLKPSIDSGSGKGIVLFTKKAEEFISGRETLDIEYLRKCSDFILQEYVEQHSFFSNFNVESNNTIRVFTYRSVITNQVHILHRLLRIGKEGSFLDHDNFGGVAAAIDSEYMLKPYCFDINGNKLYKFNNYDFTTRIKVPFMQEIEGISIYLADNIYYARLLAFDFTVSKENLTLLLDINCFSNGISQYQLNNGGLFNNFTQEILDYCQAQKE